MKVKTISRSEAAASKECRSDIAKVHRNLDPRLHPMKNARELTRAVRAVKMDNIFARPFVAALSGHMDGVYATAVSSKSLVGFISGSADGEARVWDLASQKTLWSVPAHSGFVRGIAVTLDGGHFLTAGDDGAIKLWPLTAAAPAESEDGGIEPLSTWSPKESPKDVSHHWTRNHFATCGTNVDVWDHDRSEPLHSFNWGADEVVCVAWNPAESNLLASTGGDRGIALYDVRGGSPAKKVILEMRSNKLAWNPREPQHFTVANEDHNCYTFDLRKLDTAMMVHKDHVSAVMDVSYSPTGREFVSGSYDRTIRIFPVTKGRSREVYHTSRMQRVFTVDYTHDARFVLSGSDDTNVRIWKAQRSKSLRRDTPRERAKKDYLDSLKRKYSHMPEVRRIATHRIVPKVIKSTKSRQLIIDQSKRRKESNVMRHSKPGTVPKLPERKRAIVGVED